MSNNYEAVQLRGSLLARNTLFNFVGQAIPLLIGVVTTPAVVRSLGTERFGILSLAWVILGYFAIFDLGMGRATTKYVADVLSRGEVEKVPHIAWTAIAVQAIMGLAGALILLGVTPVLVEHVLNIPTELMEETKSTFYLLSLSIPVVLIAGSFSGIVEASHRFDIVNAINLPYNILTFTLPLAGTLLGAGLPVIVLSLLLGRIGVLIAFATACFHLVPSLKDFSFSTTIFRQLLVFGGWVTFGSNIMNPILLNLDRLLISSLLSVSTVAYYSIPYETIARLGIVPASLASAMFPAFSTLEGIGDEQRLSNLFARSVKYTLLLLGPLVLAITIFAQDILSIWLGEEFAQQSTLVLQILAISGLVNSLARIPSSLLPGVGRPDIPAKFRLLELPVYAVLAWFLTNRWGIAGTAVAWTLRIFLDTLLLFGASFKIYQATPRLLMNNGTVLASCILGVLAGIAYAVKTMFVLPLLVQSLIFIGFLSLISWYFWRKILDPSDKALLIDQAIKFQAKLESKRSL